MSKSAPYLHVAKFARETSSTPQYDAGSNYTLVGKFASTYLLQLKLPARHYSCLFTTTNHPTTEVLISKVEIPATVPEKDDNAIRW